MAFRSLSRLSSALSAKASTLRSFLLNFLLQCVALHCSFCFSHLSMIPYLSFDRRVRDFSRHRICFFDVLLIINGYLLSLCMKFSRCIFDCFKQSYHVRIPSYILSLFNFFKISAATYFPTQSPMQYHRPDKS